MATQTSLVAQQVRIRQWAEQIRNCQNRPKGMDVETWCTQNNLRFLYNGIIIKHQKTEPTYTKTSLFLCEKRRFFMARREKGVVPIIYFEKERGKSF